MGLVPLHKASVAFARRLHGVDSEWIPAYSMLEGWRPIGLVSTACKLASRPRPSSAPFGSRSLGSRWACSPWTWSDASIGPWHTRPKGGNLCRSPRRASKGAPTPCMLLGEVGEHFHERAAQSVAVLRGLGPAHRGRLLGPLPAHAPRRGPALRRMCWNHALAGLLKSARAGRGAEEGMSAPRGLAVSASPLCGRPGAHCAGLARGCQAFRAAPCSRAAPCGEVARSAPQRISDLEPPLELRLKAGPCVVGEVARASGRAAREKFGAARRGGKRRHHARQQAARGDERREEESGATLDQSP